ncbi:hypothetical protein WH95_18335 [Kiloniella litopenaei]|uniref:SMODS and SLOG-associating 2TM effector domain-containing protein n=1 Tax=Kiloniella litopenaei TaxID=1549748 RepID=A0A0M2R5Y6_9PROT|nr:hypothetical protein [Kiloniella litopenaei]KKJ75405.1 hypothetical protein WH95_18335 [Kiloniella litopenaei]
MEEANQAFLVALEYAQKQIDWYQFFGISKLILFRVVGGLSIICTIFIAYLSATLDDKKTTLFSLSKKKLVTILAIVSALSVSLSGFFGWRGAWESHRLAQFQIESLMVETEIRKLKLESDGDVAGVFMLANELSEETARIVQHESSEYFSFIPSIDEGVNASSMPREVR